MEIHPAEQLKKLQAKRRLIFFFASIIIFSSSAFYLGYLYGHSNGYEKGSKDERRSLEKAIKNLNGSNI
ncbi:MAG: hypothetical protein ACNS60_15850 [Candidatus Cyclobacteriaceae bacterium M2_1C_046]